MAKYYIDHDCGHTQMYQLGGKVADRERKIEWLKQSAECPRCRNKAAGVKSRCVLQATGQTGGTLEIQFFGDTYSRKDDIKALGARFSREMTTGYFDMSPLTGWVLRLADTEEQTIADAINRIAAADLPVPDINISGLDVITADAAAAAATAA